MTTQRRILVCGEILRVEGPADLWAGCPLASDDDGPAVLEVGATERRALPAAKGQRLFDGPAFSIFEGPAGLEVELRDGAVRRGWARFAWRTGQVEVLLCPCESAFDLRLKEEVLPELMVTHLWPLRGRAYLHASGTLRQGRARLFLGPSGEGKTTAARQLEGAGDACFGEDRCVAGCAPEPWAASAPWHGGAPGVGRPSPLAGLFVLQRRGRGHEPVRPLPPDEAMGHLVRNAFMPRWWRPGVEAAVDAVGRLARRVPAWSLSVPIQEIAQAVRGAEARP